MGRWNWERIAPLSGFVFVALLIVSIALVGTPPDLDSTSARFSVWIGENARDLKIGAIVYALAGAALIWFVSCLAARLRTAGEQRLAATAFGAAMVGISIHATADVIWAGLAAQTASSQPAAAKDLFTIVVVTDPLGNLIFAAMTAAVAIAAWRSQALPQWYAGLSALMTLLFLLGGVALAADGFFSPQGGAVWIANVGSLVWIVVTSVLLSRQAVREAPAATAAAAA